MEQLPLLRREMKPDDLPIIYKGAFERELDTIILKQATDPGRAELHRATNLHYARYLTLLATEPRLLDRSLDSHAELQERGLSATDADALSILSQKHRDQQPISHRTVSHDLMAMGVKPTTKNMQACAPTMAAAYRDACIAACESLGLPVQPDEIWPLPTHLEKLIQKPPHNDSALVHKSCGEAGCGNSVAASATSHEPDASSALKQPAAFSPGSSSSMQQRHDQIWSGHAFAITESLQRPDNNNAMVAEQLGSFSTDGGPRPGITTASASLIDSSPAIPTQKCGVGNVNTAVFGRPLAANVLSSAPAQLTGLQRIVPKASQAYSAHDVVNTIRSDSTGTVLAPYSPEIDAASSDADAVDGAPHWLIGRKCHTEQLPAAHEKNGCTAPLLSKFAQATVAEKVESGAWRKDRARDILAAVAIFIAANDDMPVNCIEQQHLANMARLFPRLPKVYGHKRKIADGSIAAETIEEALIRGDELREIWAKDPVEAETQNVPYVGLSLVTQNKHLTWISALITHLDGEASHIAPTGLKISAIRKRLTAPSMQGERVMVSRGQKKNTGRLPWAIDDLKRLFQAPIWHGCAGLWHRFTPGNLIIHDGSYWVPLLLISNYGRVSEIAGLATDDVHLDCVVPYLQIRENALRGLKTTSSVRNVPIPSRVLDLGFADYVRAMRSAGHKPLFPEFHHPTMTFQQNFSKIVFTPLRNFAFPDGTSRKRGRKDVDSHSIRTFGMDEVSKHLRETNDLRFDKEHRNALGGHEQEGTAAEHYLEDMRPRDLLPQVDFLTSFIPDIPKHPLNLRPPEYQKFGRPMGRPRIVR